MSQILAEKVAEVLRRQYPGLEASGHERDYGDAQQVAIRFGRFRHGLQFPSELVVEPAEYEEKRVPCNPALVTWIDGEPYVMAGEGEPTVYVLAETDENGNPVRVERVCTKKAVTKPNDDPEKIALLLVEWLHEQVEMGDAARAVLQGWWRKPRRAELEGSGPHETE